jgi:hypothetical protein
VTKSCSKNFPNKYYKKLDRKIKMTEKESTQNHLWFKSYKENESRDPFEMNRKLSRGQTEKTENGSVGIRQPEEKTYFARRRHPKTVRIKQRG